MKKRNYLIYIFFFISCSLFAKGFTVTQDEKNINKKDLTVVVNAPAESSYFFLFEGAIDKQILSDVKKIKKVEKNESKIDTIAMNYDCVEIRYFIDKQSDWSFTVNHNGVYTVVAETDKNRIYTTCFTVSCIDDIPPQNVSDISTVVYRDKMVISWKTPKDKDFVKTIININNEKIEIPGKKDAIYTYDIPSNTIVSSNIVVSFQTEDEVGNLCKPLVLGSDNKVKETFEKDNMVEILPKGQKKTLRNFSRTKGSQNIFAYSICKNEVTQELYQSVTGENPSEHKGEKLPVEYVTWYDAVYFCNEFTKITIGEENCCYTITDIKKDNNGNITDAKVSWDQTKKGYRLPTEAEWEYAARGGVKGGWNYEYSGSDDIYDVAWFDLNSNNETHNVGIKQSNRAGLYDMTGNVWEWCWNIWSEGSSYRVYRGGSFCNDIYYSSVSYSSYNTPEGRSSNLGFRICRSLPTENPKDISINSSKKGKIETTSENSTKNNFDYVIYKIENISETDDFRIKIDLSGKNLNKLPDSIEYNLNIPGWIRTEKATAVLRNNMTATYTIPMPEKAGDYSYKLIFGENDYNRKSYQTVAIDFKTLGTKPTITSNKLNHTVNASKNKESDIEIVLTGNNLDKIQSTYLDAFYLDKEDNKHNFKAFISKKDNKSLVLKCPKPQNKGNYEIYFEDNANIDGINDLEFKLYSLGVNFPLIGKRYKVINTTGEGVDISTLSFYGDVIMTFTKSKMKMEYVNDKTTYTISEVGYDYYEYNNSFVTSDGAENPTFVTYKKDEIILSTSGYSFTLVDMAKIKNTETSSSKKGFNPKGKKYKVIEFTGNSEYASFGNGGDIYIKFTNDIMTMDVRVFGISLGEIPFHYSYDTSNGTLIFKEFKESTRSLIYKLDGKIILEFDGSKMTLQEIWY